MADQTRTGGAVAEPCPLSPRSARQAGLPPPPGAATGRAARREQFLATWLLGSLEAGDTLVASAEGLIRPRRAREAAAGAIALAGITGIYPGWPDWASHSGRVVHALVALCLAIGGLWSAGDALTRQRVSLVVTERQLILVGLSLDRAPARVLTSVPAGAVRTTIVRRSVMVTAADGSELRVGRRRQARVAVRIAGRLARRERIAAALASAGGAVAPP
jgi:hypothetical protein